MRPKRSDSRHTRRSSSVARTGCGGLASGSTCRGRAGSAHRPGAPTHGSIGRLARTEVRAIDQTSAEYLLSLDVADRVDVVADGEPGLLYVGNEILPRHVVLVLPGDGDRTLDVYDPFSGRVTHLRRDDFVDHRLGLSGWDVPWLTVQPTGLRRARVGRYAVDLDPAPA